MEGTYEIFFGNQKAGRVQVLRQGLYYRFICRCQLSGNVVCRLIVACGEKQEDLGIVVPMGDGFGMETRLPRKKLGEEPFQFKLVPKHEKAKGTFIAVYPEEPFSYIARLKDAYLVRKDGQIGVMLK